MRVHHRIYNWFQENPGKVDLIIMLSAFAVSALPYVAAADLPAFVLSALLIIPLAWRRTHSWQAGAAMAIAALLNVAFLSVPVPAHSLVLVMVFSLAAYAPRWASLGGLVLALLGGAMFVVRFSFIANGSTGSIPTFFITFVAIDAVVLVAWTLGDLVRNRRLTVQALQDRAHRLEIERQQERDLAAADERSHIAREMHDIVAHSLSVIITQADGARYASAQDPAVATETLGTIAETGRASLRDMRRLLGVLRGDDVASVRPLPTLADVETLVETVRRSGLEVALERTGEPRRAMPAGAELTGYRVVQEGLTNVLKHAGPNASAHVLLAWTGRGLQLRIDDDGRGAGADPATAGSGQGITGMAERLSLYDGTVEAAPKPGGGFRVHAFIPYTEA
ncbi:sensor histidine kinase [Arthrobacter crystallopoietes]|uniref:histidine kinase n=1 Tax=Crystallibacter crystallopoietes TaxID=37928 RepID=A0A1H1G2H6_9MICC|nr:histidine kinase [Arthrobacter crystallopoietes]AUI52796.1 two-component sensor histidine kinase [Arthrobacter crystallopoietes]SDR07424.1 Signal transduction histidine kinase [Arthrobacter crystallopoietes]